ncbi:MAG: recombinase family protein [Oscillospiraceae bacterium]
MRLVSNKENIDTSTPTRKLMLTMIGAINEFARTNLLERQREGIAITKTQGKFKGRKEINIPNFEQHYIRYMNREVSKAKLAKELDVSRPTLDKQLILRSQFFQYILLHISNFQQYSSVEL